MGKQTYCSYKLFMVGSSQVAVSLRQYCRYDERMLSLLRNLIVSTVVTEERHFFPW
jgi:hypothetical protein